MEVGREEDVTVKKMSVRSAVKDNTTPMELVTQNNGGRDSFCQSLGGDLIAQVTS